MSIVYGKPNRKIELDLTGPDGNAFSLLARARILAMDLGLDSDKIFDEMTSSDYENLVNVFDKYFGDHIILYR